MIDRASIMAWNEHAPWIEPFMVEQDLIICRALVDIFSDEFLREQLAFRGGTALHKLYLQPQPRYSEDIDLVQIHPGPSKPYSTGYYSYAKNYVKSFGLYPFSEQQKQHILSLNTKAEVDHYVSQVYGVAL